MQRQKQLLDRQMVLKLVCLEVKKLEQVCFERSLVKIAAVILNVECFNYCLRKISSFLIEL